MLGKRDIANYFISLDDNKYFNNKLIERNGSKFYEGNARLNKMMHLAQNIYLAMNDELLIDADFYAYDNGAVIPEIVNSYSRLLNQKKDAELPDDVKIFLKKIFIIFKDTPIDELIEIDHEDPEWRKKQGFYDVKNQIMNTKDNVEDYKKRYADIIYLLENMEV